MPPGLSKKHQCLTLPRLIESMLWIHMPGHWHMLKYFRRFDWTAVAKNTGGESYGMKGLSKTAEGSTCHRKLS